MYTVQEDRRIDGWDEVVDGYYYKQQGAKQNSYVLLRETGVATILFHLVCQSKFPMPQAMHK
jgi:hypothetical protein